jgi:hypothetical protein
MRIAQHLISGGTQTKAPPSIAAHIASNAIDFFRVMKKSQLLPLNAADRAWSNPIGIEKGGEHQSQILSFKRRTTCPLKRGRSTLEPIDDTIGRMVANHQAVARANAYVASKVSRSGGRARNREGEGSMTHRNLIDAMNHSGGVEATAW